MNVVSFLLVRSVQLGYLLDEVLFLIGCEREIFQVVDILVLVDVVIAQLGLDEIGAE